MSANEADIPLPSGDALSTNVDSNSNRSCDAQLDKRRPRFCAKHAPLGVSECSASYGQCSTMTLGEPDG
jgi:hypothetical protein